MTRRSPFNTLLLLAALMPALLSCDPGISVVIINGSKADKHIRVIYPPGFKKPFGMQAEGADSIMIYTADGAPDQKSVQKTPVLTSDTLERTYSFLLKAGQEAVVESRSMTAQPTYGQFFIIDNNDTVELKQKDRQFVKRPKLMLGGAWTYTIKR